MGLFRTLHTRFAAKGVDRSKVGPAICYFLVCFKSAEFVAFLMASLYNETDIFIIHCDRKAPKSLKTFLYNLSKKYKNVVQLESQEYSWAGYSHVKITLEAMRAVSGFDDNWTHFVCLSEQHLPLKGPEQIRQFLRSRKSMAVFRNAAAMAGGEIADLKNRFAAVYRELPGVGCFAVDLSQLDDHFLSGIYHGSNWIILHRTHCVILLNAEADGRFKTFEQAVHSEETAIQSILAPFNEDIEEHEPTLVAFPHLTDNHALIMTEDLFRSALDTNYLFIRKRMDVLTPFVMTKIKENHFVPDILAMGAMGPPSSAPKDKTSRVLFDAFQRFLIRKHGDRLKIDRVDPDIYGSVPRIHWIVATPDMSGTYSVRVLSENYQDFRVCFVKEERYPAEFPHPFINDGILYSTVRARLFGLFCYRDILPLSRNDRGFVFIATEKEMAKLYLAVEEMLFFGEDFVKQVLISSHVNAADTDSIEG